VPLQSQARKSLGFKCPLHRSDKVFDKPGLCPFCGLKLKEHVEGPAEGQAVGGLGPQWPVYDGRAAAYVRPFEVREMQVETLIRAAGPARGLRLDLEVPLAQQAGLRLGSSAMVMPPQGFARPIQAEIAALGPGSRVRLRLPRALPGTGWGLAELRAAGAPQLAVPLTALLEQGSQPKVYVLQDGGFAPRAVTITVRGENYAAVQGLNLGETVAGSGVFWLDAQWRMDHP